MGVGINRRRRSPVPSASPSRTDKRRVKTLSAPAGLTPEGLVLWQAYSKRASYVESDRPYLAIVVRLHERLDQVSRVVDKDTDNGKKLLVPSVQGTKSHPLLGHEREHFRQLRAAISDLDDRVRVEREQPETAKAVLERRLRIA